MLSWHRSTLLLSCETSIVSKSISINVIGRLPCPHAIFKYLTVSLVDFHLLPPLFLRSFFFYKLFFFSFFSVQFISCALLCYLSEWMAQRKLVKRYNNKQKIDRNIFEHINVFRRFSLEKLICRRRNKMKKKTTENKTWTTICDKTLHKIPF